MPVATIEKQADIPKGFEADYEERDGAWHWIDPAAKLKDALDKERDARKLAEAGVKKAAKEAAEAQARADAAKAGVTDEQLKKIREDAAAEARAEFEPALKDAATLKAENRALKLDSAVQEMLATAKVLPERLEKLWKLHGDEFDLTDDGKPMVKGKPGVDPVKHVAALVKLYPEWVQGTKAAGGGAAGTTSGGAGGAADQVGKVDPVQRLRAAHEAGATA